MQAGLRPCTRVDRSAHLGVERRVELHEVVDSGLPRGYAEGVGSLLMVDVGVVGFGNPMYPRCTEGDEGDAVAIAGMRSAGVDVGVRGVPRVV